ncbi:MAG: DUF4331 domain-containing protein [Chloroflexi bacterium]|nr:DUF4331 domain-containing protein [Chloroflexota bacterium]
MGCALAIESNAPYARASSHREAPIISQDPTADGTDFYMFVSPDKPDTVTFIASYYPFQDPAGGPNFYRLGDDVLYSINIDNVGDAQAHIQYQFQFSTSVQNPNTFLYNLGPIASLNDKNWNVRQSFNVTRLDIPTGAAPAAAPTVAATESPTTAATPSAAATPTAQTPAAAPPAAKSTVLGSNLLSPPNNIGPKSVPNYDALASAAVYDFNGTKVFAGQRDDPFFVDLGATFDLLTIRPGAPGNKGGGKDDLSGMNVHTIAIQVPITQLTKDGKMPTSPDDSNAVIGAWTTAYRRATRVLNSDGTSTSSGDWVQVSRLGHPLVNEVVVPLGAKDLWNGSKPADDKQFLAGVTDPEAAKLLNLLYGIQVPPTPRNDLVAIFLTGIQGLNQPPNVTPSEMLRLNVAIPPAKCDLEGGRPHFFGHRMGLLGGDKAGYPNGRRLSDDVVDIALQAVAGGTPFTPDSNKAPNNQLGDGVDQNDLAYIGAFPYLAGPQSGFAYTTQVTQQPPGVGAGCTP